MLFVVSFVSFFRFITRILWRFVLYHIYQKYTVATVLFLLEVHANMTLSCNNIIILYIVARHLTMYDLVSRLTPHRF